MSRANIGIFTLYTNEYWTDFDKIWRKWPLPVTTGHYCSLPVTAGHYQQMNWLHSGRNCTTDKRQNIRIDVKAVLTNLSRRLMRASSSFVRYVHENRWQLICISVQLRLLFIVDLLYFERIVSVCTIFNHSFLNYLQRIAGMQCISFSSGVPYKVTNKVLRINIFGDHKKFISLFYAFDGDFTSWRKYVPTAWPVKFNLLTYLVACVIAQVARRWVKSGNDVIVVACLRDTDNQRWRPEVETGPGITGLWK